MTRVPLPRSLIDTRLVAVMRGMETGRCLEVAQAARRGGVTVFEVTMDSPRARETIEALASEGHVVGAGTVMSLDDAHGAIEAGARFLVSPHTVEHVVRWVLDRGLPIIPGAYTPTEVLAAWDLGVSGVKLFPVSVGGPDLVRAITTVFGDVSLMVTGGVDATNVGSYLTCGASVAGVGGWLVGSDDLVTVRHRAQALVEAVDLSVV